MEAKEKAQELVKSFRSHSHSDFHPQTGYDMDQGDENAKQCAIIAVDEIINLLAIEPPRPSNIYQTHKYWLQVKEEINKL